jgi:hypothetical protein
MTLCCHPTRHARKTRSGQRPSCPKGDRKIPAAVAAYMTRRYAQCNNLRRISFSDANYLCRRCLEYETEFYENQYSHNRTTVNSDVASDNDIYNLHQR